MSDRMKDQMDLELFLFGQPLRSIQDLRVPQQPSRPLTQEEAIAKCQRLGLDPEELGFTAPAETPEALPAPLAGQPPGTSPG